MEILFGVDGVTAPGGIFDSVIQVPRAPMDPGAFYGNQAMPQQGIPMSRPVGPQRALVRRGVGSDVSQTADWVRYRFIAILDPQKGPRSPDFSMHFTQPSSPPITREQELTIASKLNSALAGKLRVIGRPYSQAKAPTGQWVQNQPLNFEFVFDADVAPNVSPQSLMPVISGEINNKLLYNLGAMLSDIGLIAQKLGEGLGKGAAGAFWGLLKPLLLPTVIVLGGYLVITNWPLISRALTARVARASS